MAHHSSEDPSSFLSDLFQKHVVDMNEQAQKIYDQLGATNRFPQGKLVPEDEGELCFGVTVKGDKVILAFKKPVTWIGMDATQAHELGVLLVERAVEAKRNGGK